jgi:hypothetical protein
MIKKSKKHFRRRIRNGTMKQNTRRNRNKRNKNRRNNKKGGSYRYYSEEDMNLFMNYISDISDDNKKQWLLQNIKRMPYEEDYEYNFPMTTPPDDFDTEAKYYQGIDRIQGYLRGYGQW